MALQISITLDLMLLLRLLEPGAPETVVGINIACSTFDPVPPVVIGRATLAQLAQIYERAEVA